MRVRLVMSPVESDLLPVYERILSIQQERARGRVFRALLAHAGASSVLPDWFLAYPHKSFPSQRGQTVRLRIDPKDMATQWLVGRIAHLGGVEQVLEIKKVLKGLCLGGDKTIVVAPATQLPIETGSKESAGTSLAVAAPSGDDGGSKSAEDGMAKAIKDSRLKESCGYF